MLGLQTPVLQPPHLPPHGHLSRVLLPGQLSPSRQLISILSSSSCNSSISCSLHGKKETWSSTTLVVPPHPHHDGSPLSSLPTPSSKAETGQGAGMRCPKVPSRCVLPPLGDQHPTLGTSARWQQDGASRMGAQGWVLAVPKGATHVPISPQPSPTYLGWR